jgi:hypothetical protein
MLPTPFHKIDLKAAAKNPNVKFVRPDFIVACECDGSIVGVDKGPI